MFTHGGKNQNVNIEGYDITQRLYSTIFVCSLASVGFLPLMLGMDLYDDDSSVPYSDGSGDVLIDVTNGAVLACSTMLWVEAFLDSNTLYIPIKIAFPRFLMVFGVMLISLSFYGYNYDNCRRLHYLVCMQYAKGYFICGGLLFKLVVDAVGRGSRQWVPYVGATVVYGIEFLVHQWAAYFPPSETFDVVQILISVCAFLISLCFLHRVVQLAKNPDEDGSYDVMSHFVIVCFHFGTIIVSFSFGSVAWKTVTAAEIAAYNFVGLFIIALFFFTSSHIAQIHFVTAQGQLINKKSFVRYVSHEIRTPLNIVYMGIQLLSTELKQAMYQGHSSELLDVVNDISASCSTSINILNDLLLIDKIEEGNLNLDLQQGNAKDIIEPCVRSFDVQAKFCKVEMIVNLLALTDVTIDVDETKIVQVVRNIVSNALKFTPRGGRIAVKAQFIPTRASDPSSNVHPSPIDRCDRQSGKIRIEFLDTGPGMSEGNKAKLFESVVQFNPNLLQKGGGSGLGLFISNAIMKRHAGGVIGVMPGGVEAVKGSLREGSREERLAGSQTATSGSLFFMEMNGVYCNSFSGETATNVSKNTITLSFQASLPPEFDHSKRFSPVVSFRRLDSGEVQAKKMFARVLVVEDSKFNRKMMVKAVSPYANEVVTADDGVEAVAAVRGSMEKQELPFDVIFMDSLMPNMNGIDATKVILKELNFFNPIIAVTGNVLPEDVREFKEAGALTVLGKPLELDMLREVLAGVDERRGRTRKVSCAEM